MLKEREERTGKEPHLGNDVSLPVLSPQADSVTPYSGCKSHQGCLADVTCVPVPLHSHNGAAQRPSATTASDCLAILPHHGRGLSRAGDLK